MRWRGWRAGAGRGAVGRDKRAFRADGFETRCEPINLDRAVRAPPTTHQETVRERVGTLLRATGGRHHGHAPRD